MKKLFLIILAALLLMTTGITAVFAVNGVGKNFVDENGDMICDNKPQCTQEANFADENKGPVCDRPNENCIGKGFEDADNDGVCDNQGVNCKDGFTYADEDGICDNKTEDCPQKSMCGRQNGQGKGKHCQNRR